MGFFSMPKPKKKNESYEKLYRVKVEPVDESQVEQTNTNEVIVKEKE
jgi:hypothetical protein